MLEACDFPVLPKSASDRIRSYTQVSNSTELGRTTEARRRWADVEISTHDAFKTAYPQFSVFDDQLCPLLHRFSFRVLEGYGLSRTWCRDQNLSLRTLSESAPNLQALRLDTIDLRDWDAFKAVKLQVLELSGIDPGPSVQQLLQKVLEAAPLIKTLSLDFVAFTSSSSVERRVTLPNLETLKLAGIKDRKGALLLRALDLPRSREVHLTTLRVGTMDPITTAASAQLVSSAVDRLVGQLETIVVTLSIADGDRLVDVKIRDRWHSTSLILLHRLRDYDKRTVISEHVVAVMPILTSTLSNVTLEVNGNICIKDHSESNLRKVSWDIHGIFHVKMEGIRSVQ